METEAIRMQFPMDRDEEEMLLVVDVASRALMCRTKIRRVRSPFDLAYSCCLSRTEGQDQLTQRALAGRTWPGVLQQRDSRTKGWPWMNS